MNIQNMIKVIIGVVYTIFIIFGIYVAYPLINSIIQSIEGVTRILAIAGTFIFLTTLLLIVPYLIMAQETSNEE